MVGVDLIEKVTFEESLELWKELITRIYKRIFQAAPRPWIAQGITKRSGVWSKDTRGEEKDQVREEMGVSPGQSSRTF